MAGGIQPGTVATDSHARKLDEQCKNIKNDLYEELKEIYPELVMQKKLKSSQIPGGIGACEPDGGLWFFRDILIAVFEGKKQNDAGNAIERWFKNNFICRLINQQVSYVTFCIGNGAYSNLVEKDGSKIFLSYGQIVKALNVAHLDGFNQYNPGKNSAYLNPEGFTGEQINAIMKEVLIERIERIKNEVA